jgi:hypothetical protein
MSSIRDSIHIINDSHRWREDGGLEVPGGWTLLYVYHQQSPAHCTFLKYASAHQMKFGARDG